MLRCVNIAFRMHEQYLQLNKVQNYSSTERKRWNVNPIEICQHLLGWSDQQLAKIISEDAITANASSVKVNAVWIFNFLLRLEQLITLLSCIVANGCVVENLMDQHRSLTVRLSKCLPRGNYRACFDEEEKQSEGARLAKLDEEKWMTGMPNDLNRLTSDYCSFDIFSDFGSEYGTSTRQIRNYNCSGNYGLQLTSFKNYSRLLIFPRLLYFSNKKALFSFYLDYSICTDNQFCQINFINRKSYLFLANKLFPSE